jgi:acetate kinase
VTEPELAEALEHRSGLLALGGSADMRDILERADTDADAALARDVYLHRLRAGVASMAAALGGLDVLVFTGGVGEHAPAIREGAAGGLGLLGVSLDSGRNARARGDAEIHSQDSPVASLVLTAREDLEMARQTRETLSAAV